MNVSRRNQRVSLFTTWENVQPSFEAAFKSSANFFACIGPVKKLDCFTCSTRYWRIGDLA